MSHGNFIALPKSGGRHLSRIHCTIFKEEEKWFICDGESGTYRLSKSGIFLDGKRITKPIELSPGQTFVILNPPPAEILLRIPEEEIFLEDTLTPALISAYGGELAPGQAEDLRAAVEKLHDDIRQNAALDQQLHDDVAVSRVERVRLREELEKAIATFSQCATTTAQRVDRAEQRTALLTRMVSGLALGLAVALLSLSPPMDDQRRSLSLEVALELLLGLAGGGGLVAAGKFHNSGDNREDRFLAPNAIGSEGSPTGDAGAGAEHPEG